MDDKALRRERKKARRAAAAQEGPLPSEPPIAFVHIPKTAGGTLKGMFIQAYTRGGVLNAGNYLRSPENTAVAASRTTADMRITIGHTPYGLFREHLPADARYITFLREPVDRAMSHYYRHLKGKAPTLQAALEAGMPEVTNLMTRFLCDAATLDELPDSALDEAKANLETFAFVGLQEHFDESVVLMQEALGMPRTPYGVSAHVNSDRPAVEEVSESERELIASHNRLDVELHEWAQTRFDAVMESRGEELATAARALRSDSEATAVDQTERVDRAVEWLKIALPPGSERPVAELAAEAEAAGITRPQLNRAKRQLKPECRNLFKDSGVHWIMQRPGEAPRPRRERAPASGG